MAERRITETTAAAWSASSRKRQCGDATLMLEETTFDIHLNGGAFWRNVPATVWCYKLGGSKSSRNGSRTANEISSAVRSRSRKSSISPIPCEGSQQFSENITKESWDYGSPMETDESGDGRKARRRHRCWVLSDSLKLSLDAIPWHRIARGVDECFVPAARCAPTW